MEVVGAMGYCGGSWRSYGTVPRSTYMYLGSCAVNGH